MVYLSEKSYQTIWNSTTEMDIKTQNKFYYAFSLHGIHHSLSTAWQELHFILIAIFFLNTEIKSTKLKIDHLILI